MAETSKHYFHICFMRDATIKFKRGSKTPDTAKLTYVLYISIGNWKKDIVLWKKVK